MSIKAQEKMMEVYEKICRLEALMWRIDERISTEDPEELDRQAWMISLAYDEVLRLKKFVGSIEYSKL